MRRSPLALLLAPLVLACEPDPCQYYVDYMCECHDGEDGVDCEELRRTYDNPSSRLQDECAIALEDQEDEDAANDHECAA